MTNEEKIRELHFARDDVFRAHERSTCEETPESHEREEEAEMDYMDLLRECGWKSSYMPLVEDDFEKMLQKLFGEM